MNTPHKRSPQSTATSFAHHGRPHHKRCAMVKLLPLVVNIAIFYLLWEHYWVDRSVSSSDRARPACAASCEERGGRQGARQALPRLTAGRRARS